MFRTYGMDFLVFIFLPTFNPDGVTYYSFLNKLSRFRNLRLLLSGKVIIKRKGSF